MTPVREPGVGQSWTYAKRDLFTGAVVDTQVDEVVAVDHTVEIASRKLGDEAANAVRPTSGSRGWLRKYFSHPRAGGPLPSEIQEPWGKVLVDPHWGQIQVFETSIPLWPISMSPGWHTHFNARYRTSDHIGAPLPWEQSMKSEDWESITVPAGQFHALRFINVITFQSSNPARTHSMRRETLWFAPEIGRWVVRESKGSYYLDDSVSDEEYKENSFRWELLAWT